MDGTERYSKVYRLAYECVERKAKGCTENCNYCRLNIAAYIPDIREAMLIKTNAELDYVRLRRNKVADNTMYTICYLILFAFLGFVIYQCKSCSAPGEQPPPTRLEDIRLVREITAEIYESPRDMNGDWQINCIDYACMFYKRWPGKCRIIQNTHGTFNHMFNAIMIDGGWRYIEPWSKGAFLFYMEDVWGNKYHPAWNIDRTDEYRRYCR